MSNPKDSTINLMNKFDVDDITIMYQSLIGDLVSTEGFIKTRFSKYRIKLSKNLYKLDLLNAVSVIAQNYRRDFYVVNEDLRKIVLRIQEDLDKWTNELNRKIQKNIEFHSKYQSDYEEINQQWVEKWEDFDLRIRTYMRQNIYPKRKKGIFFDNYKKIRPLQWDYEEQVVNIIKSFREETKNLPDCLELDCEQCNSRVKFTFILDGPGNSQSLRQNQNLITITTRDSGQFNFPREVLKSGCKVEWRNIFGVVGKCDECGWSPVWVLDTNVKSYSSLGIEHPYRLYGQETEKFFENNFKCCIYLYQERKSWYEWSGVWNLKIQTIAEELGYELNLRIEY